MRILTAIVVSLTLALATQAAETIKDTRQLTDIPAQALKPALQQLSDQRRFQIVFLTDTVGRLQTSGATGNLTTDEALSQILAGTGLTFKYVDEKTVTVIAADSATATPSSTSEWQRSQMEEKLRMAQAEGSEPAATESSLAETPEATEAELAEIVVTGSRFGNRTALTSPVPVDTISAESLRAGGHTELAESLAAAVPSLNFQVAAPASSASALRPITLRGLPANEVLILVNGKRWHASSVYGTGVLAFDFNSFPSTSVGSVDVLRDGAAAQYGSDAIAGVVNLRLRRDTRTELTGTSGQYFAGDGLTVEAGFDTGLAIGQDGFLHASAYFRDADNTNRQGRDVRQQYFAFDPGGNPVVLPVTGPDNATPVLPPGYSFDPRELSGVDRNNNYNLGNAKRREAGVNFNSELPGMLLHLESLASDRGMENLSFEVPSINSVVMHHLLERRYKIDLPPNLLMSSKDFGRFDRFVAFAPSIVL